MFPSLRPPGAVGRRRSSIAARAIVLLVAALPVLSTGGVPRAVSASSPGAHDPGLGVTGVLQGDRLSAEGEGWSAVPPAVAPVVESASAFGSLRGPGTGERVPGEDPRRGPASERTRRTLSGRLRIPLERPTPHRPAGAFLPHRATAPPFQA
jgi:hypothetical protein